MCLAAAAPQAGQHVTLPAGTDCAAVSKQYQAGLARAAAELRTAEGRDALARVAYAEAGNQGDSGLAGVVYTIANRLIDGTFGDTLPAVLNAPNQFEPVSRAGGRWTGLPARSAVEQAHIDTIVSLALDGRLPDLTGGARYFQNPKIVAGREAAGTVSKGLTNFGGQAPIARIGDHAFFDGGPGHAAAEPKEPAAIFVPVMTAAKTDATSPSTSPVSSGAMFLPVANP